MPRGLGLNDGVLLAAAVMVAVSAAACATSTTAETITVSAQLSPVPAAEGDDLAVSVARVQLSAGSDPADGDRLWVEVTVSNKGVTDLELPLPASTLRLSDPGATEGGQIIKPTFDRGFFDSEARAATRQRPTVRSGETLVVLLRFDGMREVDPMPRRVTLQLELPGRAVELLLADPTRGEPRWQLAPAFPPLSLDLSLVNLGKDRLGVGVGASVDVGVGPLVLQIGGGALIADEGGDGDATGTIAEARLIWPLPLLRLLRTVLLPPRSYLSPHLAVVGGSTRRPSFSDDGLAVPASSRHFVGLEVGLSFTAESPRIAAAPLPLVRNSSPLGGWSWRLAYVHWLGEGIPSAGWPGFVARVSVPFR